MTVEEQKAKREQEVIKKREDILLVLASMQIYLDSVDNIKGTFLYSKKAKFHASNYFREVEKMEKIITHFRSEDTRENYNTAMNEYTQVAQAVEQFTRRILRIDSKKMVSFNNDINAILKKYGV